MITTQDVSFGACWVRLLGDRACWEPGNESVSALAIESGEGPRFGAGLVAVWVTDGGPALVCKPAEGLRAIKDFTPPADPEVLRRALREAGAVVREYEAAPRDGYVD